MLIRRFFEALLAVALLTAVGAAFFTFPGRELTLIVALLVALFSILELIFYYYHQKKSHVLTVGAIQTPAPQRPAVAHPSFLSVFLHPHPKTVTPSAPLKQPAVHHGFSNLFHSKETQQKAAPVQTKAQLAQQPTTQPPAQKKGLFALLFPHAVPVRTTTSPVQPEQKSSVPAAPQKQAEHHGLFTKLFPAKPKITLIKPVAPSEKQVSQPVQPSVQQASRPAPAVKGKEYDLLYYVEQALIQGFSKSKIREAALKGRWPADAVDAALDKLSKQRLKKKVSILFVLIALLFGIIIWLKVSDNFLYPYWMKTLGYQSTAFYIGAMFVLMAVVLLYGYHIKKVVQLRHAEIVAEQEQNVQEIKQTIHMDDTGSDQTDLDKLYKICVDRGKLGVGEVAKLFGVDKSTAEEWGKILKEQGLIDLYYPTVGEPELRCAK